jgi:hypothetical protein
MNLFNVDLTTDFPSNGNRIKSRKYLSLATPERVLISQQRPEAEGLISTKMP